jgi:hypothetical protein
MSSKKLSATVCVVIGMLSLIVSLVYLTHTAGSLPHFFLGYDKGSVHKHIKHAFAFIVLALVMFLGAWMLSGPSNNKKPVAKV